MQNTAYIDYNCGMASKMKFLLYKMDFYSAHLDLFLAANLDTLDLNVREICVQISVSTEEYV